MWNDLAVHPKLCKKFAMTRNENPEWTKQDFARAKTGKDMPPHIRIAFPKTLGRPKGQAKQLVSPRLNKGKYY